MPKDLRPSPHPPESAEAKDDVLTRVPISPAEVAHYIAEFSAELSSLAREAKLDFLAYLLDMAQMEAIGAGNQARSEA